MDKKQILDTETLEYLIENVTKIANHNKITKYLEPDLIHHSDIKEWMVKRVIYSYWLLIKAKSDMEL